MSRQNSALASLTATYTDTDSEPEEDEDIGQQDPVSSVEAPVEEFVQPTPPDNSDEKEKEKEEPLEVESAPPVEEDTRKKHDLVSYHSMDDKIDDDAIDDYDYYRDSRNASEDEEESNKDSSKDSPDVKPDDADAGVSEASKEGDESPSMKKRKGNLPPPSNAPVSAEAQRIVDKMFESKTKRNLDVNKYIQSNKSFRNPSIYEKLIEFCDIDELGTNYPKDVFNPHEWPASSYYDELAKTQKTEMDRREKARRERVKVEFVAGVVPKKPIPMMASSASAAAAAAALTAAKLAAAAPKEQEKRKSKWDQRV